MPLSMSNDDSNILGKHCASPINKQPVYWSIAGAAAACVQWYTTIAAEAQMAACKHMQAHHCAAIVHSEIKQCRSECKLRGTIAARQ
jgi:hypothetical protein